MWPSFKLRGHSARLSSDIKLGDNFSRSNRWKKVQLREKRRNFTLILHMELGVKSKALERWLEHNKFTVTKQFSYLPANKPFKITLSIGFFFLFLLSFASCFPLAGSPCLFFSLSQHKFRVYASLSICFVALMDLRFFFSPSSSSS